MSKKEEEDINNECLLDDGIKDKIKELNIKLQKKCKNLSIRVGRYDEMGDNVISYNDGELNGTNDKYLILFFFNNNECVSSVDLIFKHNDDGLEEIEISSETNEDYQGKKYNKMLRGVVILIASFIILVVV